MIVAERFYRSSKMFSGCQTVQVELSLSERVFKGAVGGLEGDRAVNAALNRARLAGSSPDTLNACGGSVSPELPQAVLDEARTELQSTSCRFA